MTGIYIPVKFEFDWTKCFALESGNGNVNGQKTVVLWLNANFKTGFRKRKFGEKPGIFDLSNAKK